MGICYGVVDAVVTTLRMRDQRDEDNPSANTTRRSSTSTSTPLPSARAASASSDYFEECYKLRTGAFSTVRAAVNKKTNEKVAVKIINKAGLRPQDEKDLLREVDVLKKLRHPNIVQLIDFYDEPTQYLLVMEFLEGGELFDRIVKKSYYTEKEARDLVYILLKAVKYMHDRHVVHRDLKPENLLLKSMSDDADIKIADFGFAVISAETNLTTPCGTPCYVAPEILGHHKYGGYPPFFDENQRLLFTKIQQAQYEFHPEFWSHISAEAKELISSLLVLDVDSRYTVDQALSHAWIRRSGEELAENKLDSNLGELKKFQANKKFKKVAHTIIATQKFKHLLDGLKVAKGKLKEEVEHVVDASMEPLPIMESDGREIVKSEFVEV